jgi:hypothetical protein
MLRGGVLVTRLMICSLVLAMVLRPTLALGQPDPGLCIAYSAPGVVVVCPGGDGQTLAEAGCVVTVILIDYSGVPVAGYDPGDLRLTEPWATEPVLFTGCRSPASAREGFVPDGPTDEEGRTTFSGTATLGGTSDQGLTVKIWYGDLTIIGELTGTAPLEISVRSPDLTADGVVDLADFAGFGADFGTSNPRSDLVVDGNVNIADFAFMGLHFGHHCP